MIPYTPIVKSWYLGHAEKSTVNTGSHLSTGFSLYQSDHFYDLNTQASLISSEIKNSVSFSGHLSLLVVFPVDFAQIATWSTAYHFISNIHKILYHKKGHSLCISQIRLLNGRVCEVLSWLLIDVGKASPVCVAHILINALCNLSPHPL